VTALYAMVIVASDWLWPGGLSVASLSLANAAGLISVSPEKDGLQLLHALTMSMGLQWGEATPSTGNDNNDEARMHRAADQCRYVLGCP
jgi:hypothetical protein